MVNREEGFYWVLYDSNWEVAYWESSEHWTRIGSSSCWRDDDFEEIGDRVWREPKVESFDMKCSCGRTLHQHTYCQICDNDE